MNEHMHHAAKGHTVKPEQDGTWPQTAIALYANAKFAPIVNSLISYVANNHQSEPTIVIVKCTTGYHRADVANKTFKDVVNSIEDVLSTSGGVLRRVFNASLFSFASVTKPADAKNLWKRVCSWHTSPWAIVPTPPVDQRFAYLHHTATEETNITYNQIWTHAETVLTVHEKSVPIVFGTVPDAPGLVYKIHAAPKAAVAAEAEVEIADVAPTLLPKPKLMPKPPTSAPPRKRPNTSDASGSAGDYRESIDDRVWTPNDESVNRAETCMCCGGCGMVESLVNEWATHSDDVRVWIGVLDELGADSSSQKMLFSSPRRGLSSAWPRACSSTR